MTVTAGDILVQCLDAAGLSTGALFVIEPDGGYRLQAQVGLPPKTLEHAENRFGHPELFDGALTSGAPKAFQIGDAAAAARDLVSRVGHASVLLVPLVVQGKRHGVILLASDGHDLSEPAWSGFGRALAGQFGQAVALGESAARLAESEARYRTLMERANDAILVLRGDEETIVEANRQVEALLGRPRDEIVGRRYQDFIPPEERDDAEARRQELFSRGTLRIETRRLLRADGTKVPVDLSASLVELGEQTVTLAILRDVTERVRLVSELEEQRRRLESIVGTVPGIVWEALGSSPESARTNFVSPQVQGMLGYTTEEWLSTPDSWLTMMVPEDREHALAVASAIFAGGGSGIIPFRWLTRDGRVVWAESHVALARDAAGTPFGFCGVTLDITERKKVESALVDSERRHRQLFDANPLPLWVFDRETLEFLDVNESAVRHYGYSRDAFLRMSIKDIRPPQDVPGLLEDLTRTAADGGRVAGLSTRHRRKDGTLIDVEITGHDTTFAGRPARVVVAWDVTERRRAEMERARLTRAVEQAAEFVLITDPDGTIVYVNPAFEMITGYTRAEALGKTPRLFRSRRQDDAFYRDLWATLGRGEVWKGRFVNRRKDGAEYEASATISPVRDATGNTVNYVSVQRDLTEQRRLEEQLRQAQKMEAVGQLAGGVAHDFNNLLGVITGYGELLAKDLGVLPPAQRRVEQIRKAAERAVGLTRQLLAFSRKQVLEPKVLDLSALIVDLEKMLRRLIGEDVQIVTVLGAALGRVRADPGQIEQVVVNLAVNARDAMPDGGKLIIETANADLDESYARNYPYVEPGPYVMLAVSDTGQGMDAATTARVFEPFFTTKEEGKGTGLGLSTVYGIVKQSGGHINVYSEPGHGTTFRVYLPRVAGEAEAAERAEPPPSPPSGSESVLLVEDADALRVMIREVLEGAGYSVVEASNPAEALKKAEEHAGPLHVLLTDVIMPGMSGPDLTARLETVRPGLRLVYMSGYTDEAVGHHGVLDEGTHFLQKPFTGDALLRKVREALDEAPS